MKQIHEIQLEILTTLLFRSLAKYSELKPKEMEPAQFVFHLNKLQDMGLIAKYEEAYTLTDAGKEYANRITTETTRIEERVKATTVLVPYRDSAKGRDFLIYQRLKNPFYGCFGFATEKPKWGEKIIDAARRGLNEETSLDGTPQLFAIKHYVVTSNDTIVEDKLMHAFTFENPTGTLTNNEEGIFEWVKEADLEKKINPPLEEFWNFYNSSKEFKGEVTFEEVQISTEKF